jgi:hypothetical protein
MADPLSPAAAPATGADFLAPATLVRGDAARAPGVPASAEAVGESFDAHLQRARRLQRGEAPGADAGAQGTVMPPPGGMVLPSGMGAAGVAPDDVVAEAVPSPLDPFAAVPPPGVPTSPAARDLTAGRTEVWSLEEAQGFAGAGPAAQASARASAGVVPVEATAVALASRAAAGPWAVPGPTPEAGRAPQAAESSAPPGAPALSAAAPTDAQGAWAGRRQLAQAADGAPPHRDARAEGDGVFAGASLRAELLARGDGPPVDNVARAFESDVAARARAFPVGAIDTAARSRASTDLDVDAASAESAQAVSALGAAPQAAPLQQDVRTDSGAALQARALSATRFETAPLAQTPVQGPSEPRTLWAPGVTADAAAAGGGRAAADPRPGLEPAGARARARGAQASASPLPVEFSSRRAGLGRPGSVPPQASEPGLTSAVSGSASLPPGSIPVARADAFVAAGVKGSTPGQEAAGEGARAGAPAAPPQAFDRTVSAASPDVISGERAGNVWQNGASAGFPVPSGAQERVTTRAPGQTAAGEGARAGAPAAPPQAFDRTVSAASPDVISGEWAGNVWQNGASAGFPVPSGAQERVTTRAPGQEAAGEGARAGAPAAPLQAFDRTVSAAVSDLILGELAGKAWRNGAGSGLSGPRGDNGNAANQAAAQATLAASGASLDPGRALQFAPLGPGIDLMVGPEPEPAMQDLLEFARASGIGADALERLFGPQASTGSRLGGGVSQTSLPTQTTQTATYQQTTQALPAPLPGASASTLVAPPWLAAASRVDARVDGASARPRSASFDVDGVDALLAPTAASGERSDVPASPVLSSAAAPSSAAAQPAPAQAVAGAAVPPVSYAEMSHRVAQAVASRMVAGLREGSGSLRLQLEPQSLGRVEVQMALQDGRLEATIAAHQAGTRDLLTDGIVRLRETLGQLGMNVAVINVIDGSGGRGDGKPTRQRPGDTAYSRQGAGAGRVEGASEAGRPSRGVSGLDVWA